MKGQRVVVTFVLLAMAVGLFGGFGSGYGIGLADAAYRVFFPQVLKAGGTPPPTRTPGPPPIIDPGAGWPTLAANPERTSWVPEEVRGDLRVEWYRPIEPYIPYKVQIIAANGYLYISTARGLYALNANNGDVGWVYPTELPLGHSPTVATVNGRSIAYVGGYDRKIHAIDAFTGQEVSGYTPYEAGAGFETNPLVIDNTIYAGNRDGYFYALDAVTGAFKWSYKTDGPILFSAAYKNGVVYFASNDAHAYALQSDDGSLVWKSQKFPGAGFQSYWPVIYTEKATGKDYVIFTGSENYRQSDNTSLNLIEEPYFFPECQSAGSCPWGNLIGPTTTAPSGDDYWTPGTVLIDVTKITDYYEDYSYRRTVFVLDSTNGQEYKFDSDGDGKTETAPFTWSGTTASGNKYPPVINGLDGIYYQDTMYASAPWITRGDFVGWEFGTHFVSRVADKDVANAVDEPISYASGGNLLYWSLCCDREAGAYDVTIPYGQPGRAWHYFAYNLLSLAPDYQMMYNNGDSSIYDNGVGWQFYCGQNLSNNGIYGKHGTTQSPPIPYQGRVYFLKGNAVIAFSPTASSATKLPLATTVQVQDAPTPFATAEVRQRLETEVQKMINAGHLRPGYHSAGFVDLYGVGHHNDDHEYGEIFDYFQNPADTVVTLIQALPYLSSALQGQVRAYLQTYYGPSGQFPFTSIVHTGWKDGEAREIFDIPDDMKAEYASQGPRTTPLCSTCGYWTSFPPYSFYAAWKYAQVFGGAKGIFDQMSNKLETPPSDAYLLQKPYILNLYVAGYLGYLNLQNLAGYSESTGVRNEYNRLLSLRAANFSKDAPWSGFDYNRTLSVARNFMFLTPELADYLNQNAYAKVQAAVSEYDYVAPYWFVSKFDDSYGEGTLEHLYDYPALFQAKAYILKQPYAELVKWLDVPAFYQGDLFYIQNLVATLHAQ